MNTTDLSAAVWKKSRWTNGQGACVEVARNLPGIVAVRDSKDPAGPKLVFTHGEWNTFLDRLRNSHTQR